MNLKTEITKLHYTKEPKGALFNLLKFCSIFYAAASGIKNLLYDKGFLKPAKVDAYVISVGNFTTGGVGKTPVVAELARYFVEKGEKVCIISRGYGGKLNNKKVNVISDGINLFYKADMAGDEPYWLAVNLNMCAVLTCADRVKAAEYAIKELGVTKIILDDAFQHRKIHRDLNIVLVDSEKMFGNENLLPAGPLREGLEGFKRIDRLIIVSKNIDHTRAEKLAKIMTKQDGIMTLIVKGALRPKSRLSAATLNFSIGTYVIYTSGKGLSNLRTYKEARQFDGLYNDLTKNAYISFIFDLIDHAFVEYQPIGKYYDLALFALKKIDSGVDAEMITQIV